MKILSIRSEKFQIGAVVREKGDGSLNCPLHMFLKKTQKAPAKEINRAIRAKKEYDLADKQPTPAYQAEKVAVCFLMELTTFMRAHQITNAELARRAGVSAAYITKVFRGPSNLSIETLTKLADAIGCRVHVHLANHAADVRWFDVMQAPRMFQRSIDPAAAHFVKVMEQLKPINQETFNDQKFALAA